MTTQEGKLTGYPSIDKPWEHGYSFFQRHPIIPDMSIYALIHILNTAKENIAVECHELAVTYRQMLNDAKTVSNALQVLGIKEQDIVAASMPNTYQALVLFLACNRIGAIASFFSTGMSDEEIRGCLSTYNAKIFFNYEYTQERNDEILQNTSINFVVTLYKKNENSLDICQDISEQLTARKLDFHSLGEVAKNNKWHPVNLFKQKRNALILFTSGTTGKPKAVLLSNKNVIAAGMYCKNDSKAESLDGDRTLVCVPFAYPYGLFTSALTTLLTGKTAVLAPNISPESITYYLKKKPNIIFGSPALLDVIMRNTPDDVDLSSVNQFMSGGDFLTPAHAEEGKCFFEKHGCSSLEIGNAFGNAETCSCGTNHIGVKPKPGTAGKLLVGLDAMIVDPETMQEKGYDEEGMLCVSGKHIFQGYFNAPETTKDVIYYYKGKKYFKTGTLGSLDHDGYFKIVGRLSRFYIMSSLNKVYLDHVQLVISRFTSVYECAAVRVPDNQQLWTNYVFVVLENGVEPTEKVREEIYIQCKHSVLLPDGEQEQLKEFEIPSKIIFVDQLPRRQGTDKIDYQKLETLALDFI